MAASDAFPNTRGPRLRVRFPAGGDNSKAITAVMGSPDDEEQKNVLLIKEFSIDDDMLNVADSCSFTIANPDGIHSGKITKGQRVEIEESDLGVAGGKFAPQLTGRVTSIETASDLSGGSVLLVSCMDLGWHLTSCHSQPLQSTEHTTLDRLLEKLVDSTWGLKQTVTKGLSISTSNLLNRRLKQGRTGIERSYIPPLQRAALPHIQVEPGQAPFDIIRTYCQREGIMINIGAEGDIVLFQPDYSQEPAYQVHFHASDDARRDLNNVVGRPVLRESIDGWYSEVQCWSTVVKPTNVQEAEAGLNPNWQYRHNSFIPSTNPLPFNRLFVFSDSEAIDETLRKNRATYRWQMDAWNSWTYEVEFTGHSQGGNFFVSDSMITISDTVNKIPAGAYYVQRVHRSYTLGQGIRSHLTIRQPILNPTLQVFKGGGVPKALNIPATP